MKANQHILFLTTASLAANPRLVKEFEYLKKHFNCSVVCFTHEDWSAPLSQKIVAANPSVNFVQIDRKKELYATLWSKVLHNIAIRLNPLFKNTLSTAAFASNDKTPQLVKKTMSIVIKQNFTHVIAHNLGAFYPALMAAKKRNVKLQIDIEDFYPGEAPYFNKAYETTNRHKIMQAAFTLANNITYASDGIAKKCKATYKIPNRVKQITVINSFNSTDFVPPNVKKENSLRCVWFSQNMGPNRGLEKVFDAAKEHPNIEFHLVGKRNEVFLEKYSLSKNIILHPIMTQNNLHDFISSADIGLALESINSDENRNICLANKVLAYAQAGLYILATKTYGQKQFLSSLNYKAGELIVKDLTTSLSELNKEQLTIRKKQVRWEQAKAFSWEVEQQKLNNLFE